MACHISEPHCAVIFFKTEILKIFIVKHIKMSIFDIYKEQFRAIYQRWKYFLRQLAFQNKQQICFWRFTTKK